MTIVSLKVNIIDGFLSLPSPFDLLNSSEVIHHSSTTFPPPPSHRLIQRRNNEKYLGFGAWDPRSGRRAALAAAAADASPLDSATDEAGERDHWLRAVQARDLIDFGMIPVRVHPHGLGRVTHNLLDELLVIYTLFQF